MISFGILTKISIHENIAITGKSVLSKEDCLTVQQYRILSPDIWIHLLNEKFIGYFPTK